MNESTPKKKRRRRGGSRRRGKSNQPKPEAAAQPAPKKESGGQPKGQRSGQKRSGRPGRRGEGSGKAPKASPQVTFAEMIAAYPPEYGRLPEFIKQCRGQRDKDETFSEDEFFYFLTTSVETLAEDKLDELYLAKYAEPLKAIRLREELEEDHYWKPEDPAMPEDYRGLLDEFRTEKREVLAKMFQNFGEPDLGAMVVENHSEYKDRREKGRVAFYSRHKFDAVRMEESEMNLELQETVEVQAEPEPESSFQDNPEDIQE